MITIFYGDDITKSRRDFMLLKEQHDNPVSLDGTVTLTELAQVFESNSLFEETKTVFCENLIAPKREGKEATSMLAYLADHGASHAIYIWEAKDLTKTQVSRLKNATAKQYKLPQSLFQFLESLAPGNAAQSIRLFQQTIETNEPEMAFFMLIRHLRILLALKLGETIEETRRLAPWQQGKLISQAKRFHLKQLREIYQDLAQLDKQMKTGVLGAGLGTAIDMLLLSM